MREQKRLALSIAGPVNDTPLMRLPRVVSKIGPVKAPSLRQASRVVNALKGGYPVRAVSELLGYAVYAICAPPEQVPRLARELLELYRDWSGRTVLLCSETLDSRDLEAFARQGAQTASVTAIGVHSPPQFVVEGMPDAVAAARTLLGSAGVRVFEVRSQLKPLYYASETLASSVLLPLLDAATASLRLAGIPLAQARPLMEGLVLHSLRAYARSGRKTWRAPVSESAQERLARELHSLHAADPRLRGYFEESLAAALRYFDEPAPRAQSAGAGG